MQCPHCHADGQDGRFCKKCGKPLDQDVSDMTRVMPPLEALHEKPTETAPDDEAQAAADALTEALDEAEAGEEQTGNRTRCSCCRYRYDRRRIAGKRRSL